MPVIKTEDDKNNAAIGVAFLGTLLGAIGAGMLWGLGASLIVIGLVCLVLALMFGDY